MKTGGLYYLMIIYSLIYWNYYIDKVLLSSSIIFQSKHLNSQKDVFNDLIIQKDPKYFSKSYNLPIITTSYSHTNHNVNIRKNAKVNDRSLDCHHIQIQKIEQLQLISWIMTIITPETIPWVIPFSSSDMKMPLAIRESQQALLYLPGRV